MEAWVRAVFILVPLPRQVCDIEVTSLVYCMAALVYRSSQQKRRQSCDVIAAGRGLGVDGKGGIHEVHDEVFRRSVLLLWGKKMEDEDSRSRECCRFSPEERG
ncbi:hypothetical protein GOP47_0017768 [Adiantum capillus-veneris]|uniref:Uncharacterized protein n=1 Tax=Adiantum capillus-veneris TaxID=13818 RepID=A0A9D4ZB51_ADICA|nr:hypothetical protein GOP47_0017768 [Adiantum capillus-veneris]